MTPSSRRPLPILAAGLLALLGLAGCQQGGAEPLELALAPEPDPRQQECLARAMYFESNRSSQPGMLAVGSVVMNRVDSGEYGSTVCDVVGAPKQFAPGVMTRSMTAGKDLAMDVAGDVLAGARHPEVTGRTKFFHTAGLNFPYPNMNYVAIAGGNAFYERLSREERTAGVTSQAEIRNAYRAEAKSANAASRVIVTDAAPVKPAQPASAVAVAVAAGSATAATKPTATASAEDASRTALAAEPAAVAASTPLPMPAPRG